MDAYGVLVLEGLALGVYGHEAEHRGVEGVDALVGRAAGVRLLPYVVDHLAHEAVVAAADAQLLLYLAVRVAADADVDVLHVAEADELLLATEELELLLLPEVVPVVDLEVLLGGDGEEGDVAVEFAHDVVEAEASAEHRRHLGVVTAAVGCAGDGVALGVVGDADRVELTDDADDGPLPLLLEVRLRARDPYLGLVGPAHLLVLLLRELGGLPLLEAELGLLPDRLADAR